MSEIEPSSAEKKIKRKELRLKKRKNIADSIEILTIQTIRPGDATHYPVKGDTVRIHYTGELNDGTIFDSSYKRMFPLEFKMGINAVIKGWEEGIKQMSKNQIAKLTIKHQWGYGERGFPPIIPPKATLIWTIELIDIAEAIVHSPSNSSDNDTGSEIEGGFSTLGTVSTLGGTSSTSEEE